MAGPDDRAAPACHAPSALVAAMEGCIAYEHMLGERLLAGLGRIEGLRLYGPPAMVGRVPTFAFTIDGHSPGAIAETLAREHIHAWSGHFYAVEPVTRLGLWESGGLVRVGLCHYSMMEEVERLLEVLETLGAGR